jgi:hypothetical protein
MKKRDLFAEMMQGVEEMAAHREGKITLKPFSPRASGPVRAPLEIGSRENPSLTPRQLC